MPRARQDSNPRAESASAHQISSLGRYDHFDTRTYIWHAMKELNPRLNVRSVPPFPLGQSRIMARAIGIEPISEDQKSPALSIMLYPRMAKGKGFEPSNRIAPTNALAGRRIQPTLPPLHMYFAAGRSVVLSTLVTRVHIAGGRTATIEKQGCRLPV